MTYDEWMNEVENYGTRYERFLSEWDAGMDVARTARLFIYFYEIGDGDAVGYCHCVSQSANTYASFDPVW